MLVIVVSFELTFIAMKYLVRKKVENENNKNEESIIDNFVIWNNGPKKVTKPLSFSGTLINDLDNRSLSETRIIEY